MPARKSQCENVREEPVFALGRLRLRLRFLNEEKWAAGGSGGPSRRSGLRSSGRRMGDKRRVACFPEPRSNRLTGLERGEGKDLPSKGYAVEGKERKSSCGPLGRQ